MAMDARRTFDRNHASLHRDLSTCDRYLRRKSTGRGTDRWEGSCSTPARSRAFASEIGRTTLLSMCMERRGFYSTVHVAESDYKSLRFLPTSLPSTYGAEAFFGSALPLRSSFFFSSSLALPPFHFLHFASCVAEEGPPPLVSWEGDATCFVERIRSSQTNRSDRARRHVRAARAQEASHRSAGDTWNAPAGSGREGTWWTDVRETAGKETTRGTERKKKGRGDHVGAVGSEWKRKRCLRTIETVE